MYTIRKERTLQVVINGKFHFELWWEHHLVALDRKSTDFFGNFASCGEYNEEFGEYRMEYSNGTTKCAYVLHEDRDSAELEGSYRAILKELENFSDCKIRKGYNYIVRCFHGNCRQDKIFASKAKALKWAQANCK